MKHSRTLSSVPDSKGIHFSLKPASAWIAVLGLGLFSVLCLLTGAASILRTAFPVGALGVGIFLYWRYPILYLGFTWWLWFLTPWLRRMIDYRSGWADPSLVLLSPYLVTLVTLATFLRYVPKVYRQDGLPFILSSIGVFYGLLIGLVNSKFGDNSRIVYSIIRATDFTYTPTAVVVGALEFLCPILFSFHLFINWRHYPEYRQNIQRTFLWAVLVMGAYGVVQYLVAPEWDRFWLTQVIKTGNTSFGIPEPLGIRVFSTMNSPGPFAEVMVAGLLLLLSSRGTLPLLATVAGYFTFLLTLVRSAWGGWFVGLLLFGTSLKSSLQMRLIITVLIVGMCVFPLTTVEPFSEIISARVQSLSNVQEDNSYKDRAETYDRALGVALFEPLGNGLGLPGVDSGIIDTFIQLGWFGSIPYLGGLILLLFKLTQCVERRFDTFMSSAFAISLAMLAQIGLGDPLTGVVGMVFWGFTGVALAGHKYYQYQRTAKLIGG